MTDTRPDVSGLREGQHVRAVWHVQDATVTAEGPARGNTVGLFVGSMTLRFYDGSQRPDLVSVEILPLPPPPWMADGAEKPVAVLDRYKAVWSRAGTERYVSPIHRDRWLLPALWSERGPLTRVVAEQ